MDVCHIQHAQHMQHMQHDTASETGLEELATETFQARHRHRLPWRSSDDLPESLWN